MAVPMEAGFQGPSDFQLLWGDWQFKSRPTVPGNPPITHAIGIRNLQITSSAPCKHKQNSQGYYYTIMGQKGPRKITFTLDYVRGVLNQQVHRLVDFWEDKVGQEHPLYFGGLNAMSKYMGFYILSDLKVSDVKLLPSGDIAACSLNYTFEERCFLPPGADQTGVSYSAVDIGA